MRSHLLLWVVLLAVGALAGDRYGAPAAVTGVTDKGFEWVEARLGRAGEQLDDSIDEAIDTSESPEPAAAPSGAGNMSSLKINDEGLQIIKDSEGLRLNAYSAGGRWYIGYGHARTARAGMTITEGKADQLLREDVRDAEAAVRNNVTVPINVNQFSAMTSLAYNLGSNGFAGSSVVAAINRGDYQGAADAFLNHNTAGGRVLDHLTERRQKERALFLTPT
ncbi:MAG: lysozyme [Pseudomonadota bacterium]